MCPDDTATVGNWSGVASGQLRLGFVAVLEGHIASIV
jgi:hypothetical protein